VREVDAALRPPAFAFAIAISIARRPTTWPKPPPPSSRTSAGVSAVTVTGDRGSTSFFLTDSQYWGMRITPWESWPRRFARTSSAAIHAASGSGAPIAVKMRVAFASSRAGSMVGMSATITQP
jgi:hypothetical protein